MIPREHTLENMVVGIPAAIGEQFSFGGLGENLGCHISALGDTNRTKDHYWENRDTASAYKPSPVPSELFSQYLGSFLQQRVGHGTIPINGGGLRNSP